MSGFVNGQYLPDKHEIPRLDYDALCKLRKNLWIYIRSSTCYWWDRANYRELLKCVQQEIKKRRSGPVPPRPSDSEIDELITLTNQGNLGWKKHGPRAWTSSLHGKSVYFHESYMNEVSQSKDLELRIGDKKIAITLYSFKEEQKCKLIHLGNAIESLEEHA